MVIYGLQRISSSPHVQRAKSIVCDSLLISNRGHMNPPPQEAYLYIFPPNCNPARALAAVCQNKFDELLCKLDSTELARSFEQNPTLP